MNQKHIQAQVEDIRPLTDSIMQMILVPEQYQDYKAGQYLNIIFEDQEFSYSIANAPLGSHKYELHIRHSSDNPYHLALFAHIKKHASVTLCLPYGDCNIDSLKKNNPILFIAGGTGFAPVKAMIEQLLASNDPRSFELIWGAKTRSDLYFDETVSYWHNHVSLFEYFSLVSDENKTSLASYALARHPKDLNKWQIVLSGPFDMVYSTRDTLVQHGVSLEHLFSDAFGFEQK